MRVTDELHDEHNTSHCDDPNQYARDSGHDPYSAMQEQHPNKILNVQMTDRVNMSKTTSRFNAESSPGMSVRSRFVQQGFLLKAQMQNKLFEQETGGKAYLRFDGKRKRPMSILDIKHQHSVLSSKVQSATVGESPKLKESVSLKQQLETENVSPALSFRRKSLLERSGANSPTKLSNFPGRMTTVETTQHSLFSAPSDGKRAKPVISKMADVGKIWQRNEKQKRQNRAFKRKGVKQICQYQKECARQIRFADESLMQIRKNI